jgi:hypothetical protein
MRGRKKVVYFKLFVGLNGVRGVLQLAFAQMLEAEDSSLSLRITSFV